MTPAQWRKLELRRENPLLAAVLCIQGAYRRYCDRVIYCHFRDLLHFKNSGDPVTMLRSVNPREAALVDVASGVRVRFRLGGTTFPPSMYYKLFTNASVCDLNSFAPRDYTDPTTKLPLAPGGVGAPSSGGVLLTSLSVGSSHFQARLAGPLGAGASVTESGDVVAPPTWYRRQDNNGWRLVVSATLESGELKGKAGGPRHFSRAVRASEAALARKQRKRAWLKKMYSEGLARERVPEEAEYPDAYGAGAGFGGLGSGAPGAAPRTLDDVLDFDRPDWEVEAQRLLEWSETLDFDAYMTDWVGIGTSSHAMLTSKFRTVEPPVGGGEYPYEEVEGVDVDRGAEYMG